MSKDGNARIIKALKASDLSEINKLNDLFDMARHTEDVKLGLYVVDEAARQASRQASIEFLLLYKKALLFVAPYDFDSYLLYVEFDRDPEKQFYAPRRKVLRPVVAGMQKLMDKELDFLSVALPPRTGKSTLGCFFMSWVMGKYPEDASVMSGHSDKLTSGFYMEANSIIEDPQYLWRDVFPTVKLARKSAKDLAIDLNSTKRFPTLTCRSIGGTLTGAVEVVRCLYSDDLIEDLEEALNPLRLQKKYDAYANQLKDRMKAGAFQLMIGTRWSVNDVQGIIESKYADNDRYLFLVIPALDENGESNFDYPYDLGFDTAYYEDMRYSIDEATWNAKYMGRPREREGRLFPEEELLYYNGELPPGEPDRIVAAVDIAWGGGDSVSMPIGYIYGDECYIHDVVFDTGDKFTTRPLVEGKLIEHLPHMVRGEANNGGDEYMDRVDEDLRGKGIRLNISHRKSPSTQSKMSRIIQMSPEIKRFLFRARGNRDNVYHRFMSELCLFNVSGKNAHDDSPDSLAMLAKILVFGSGSVEIFRRPF